MDSSSPHNLSDVHLFAGPALELRGVEGGGPHCPKNPLSSVLRSWKQMASGQSRKAQLEPEASRLLVALRPAALLPQTPNCLPNRQSSAAETPASTSAQQRSPAALTRVPSPHPWCVSADRVGGRTELNSI